MEENWTDVFQLGAPGAPVAPGPCGVPPVDGSDNQEVLCRC